MTRQSVLLFDKLRQVSYHGEIEEQSFYFFKREDK